MMSISFPSVGDVARRGVYEVSADEPLSKVIGIFRNKHPPIVVVMDRSGRLVGVITERIAVRATVNIDKTKAARLAIRAPTVNVGDSLAEAARLMLENNLKALPVEDGGSIIGTISIDDMVEGLGDKFFSKFKVRELMTREPITIYPNATVGQAIVKMRENGISRLPVVDGGKLVGIVTIHDVITKVVQPRERATIGEVVGEKTRTLSHPVKDIMTRTVITAHPDEPSNKAINRMLQADVSCLVVVHDGKPVGIITRADILEPIARLAQPTPQPITIQLSFKLRNLDEEWRNRILELAERYIKRVGSLMGTGNLTLHFKEHKEKHGDRRLIHCRARLNTDKAQINATGEAWTPTQAARIALDKIERKLLITKELQQRHPYAEEILQRMATEM